MEQLFLEGLKIRFLLRGTDKRKLQTIIGEFRLNNKKFQISTKLKVSPKLWDNKKQRAITSAKYSTLTNRNNRIANEKISSIELAYYDKINYLCNSNLESLNDIITILKQCINPNYAMAKKIEKKNPLILNLRSIAERLAGEKNIKEDSLRVNLTRIDDFKHFLTENKIPDDITSISYENIVKFKDYLRDRVKSQQGHSVIETIKRYLKEIPGYDSKIDKIKVKVNTLHNYVPLTIDEIVEIYNIADDELHSIVESKKAETKAKDFQLIKQYRDLFVLQCLVGCRKSDILKLVNSHFVKADNYGLNYYDFNTKKNNGGCIINFDLWDYNSKSYEAKGIINTIYNQYKDSISELKENQYNKYIKKFITLANIDRVAEYYDEINWEIVKTTKNISEFITSHDGRHSFVTNCIRVLQIPKDNLIDMTGHTDVEMINKIYANLTKEDKQQQLREIVSGNANENNNNHYPKLPKPNELKDVVKFLADTLGIDERYYIGVSNYDDLIYFLKQYEHEIKDRTKGRMDLDTIKRIYNEAETDDERVNRLKDLLDRLKA